MSKRLWESEHPYYAQEGNYFKNGCHAEFRSWEDFIAEEGDSDIDMNLVYRWDWRPVGSEWRPGETTDALLFYIVGQRKAHHRSCEIAIDPRDRERIEPLVREYLRPRLARLMEMWAPLVDSVSP